MRKRPFLGIGWVPVLIALFVALAILGTLLTQPLSDKNKGFQLQSLDGDVSLDSFQGKVVVMMFGFTHCPDICPTALANVAAALNYLDDSQLAETQPIFISVDPDRDNLEHLAKYTAYFHPKIIGITGTKEQVDAAVKNYGGFYRVVELDDSALGYTVDHSSKVYVIDQQGELAELKYHNTSPKELAESIQALL